MSRLIGVLLGAAMLAGPPARGQEPPPPPAAPAPDDAKTQLARKHYDLGEQLYKTSSYPAALAEFEKAYRLVPKPEMLFNIARCHEVMAQLDKAVGAYERYLAQRPDAKNADLVRTRLANLRRRLDERTKQEETARVERERQEKEQQEKAQQPPPGRSERPARWKRTAGWVTLGVGVASLGTGVAFGVLARKKDDDYTSGANGTLLYHELEAIDRDGKRFNKIAIATLAVGGALAAAGAGLVVWDWLSAGKAERRAALVLPFAGMSGGGVAATVGF